MSYENPQLFREDLPAFQSVKMNPLEPGFLRVLYLSRIIFSFIVLLIFGVAWFILGPRIPFIYWIGFGSFLLILITLSLLFTKMAFSIKTYGIRRKDILFTSGLIYRNTTIVPFNRVQHVEIKSGPIDRMYKLARLKIYTAGGSQSDLSIPGLNPETALQIKELIVSKTSTDEEE